MSDAPLPGSFKFVAKGGIPGKVQFYNMEIQLVDLGTFIITDFSVRTLPDGGRMANCPSKAGKEVDPNTGKVKYFDTAFTPSKEGRAKLKEILLAQGKPAEPKVATPEPVEDSGFS